MTYEELIEYINNPSVSLDKESEEKWEKLIQKYPYFHIANWTYLRLLKYSSRADYEKQLSKTALHAFDRHRLYFYVHPEELVVETRQRIENSVGSYFDMVEKFNQDKSGSKSTDNSLRSLAQKLKEAREKIVLESNKKPAPNVNKKYQKTIDNTSEKGVSDEQLMKTYIQQQRYHEAIEILERLKNLNNSKKSVYFADQIRFLRKIIEN